MKSIEFVNESKVEVKGLRYKNNLLENFLFDGLLFEVDIIINFEVRNVFEFQLLKFENVFDDEFVFSDVDNEEFFMENRKVFINGFKVNGGSLMFVKNMSLVENGLDLIFDMKCNGLEENCDLVDLLLKIELINNFGYMLCECLSEGGILNCDDKVIDGSFVCDNMECLQFDDLDYSSIKSLKFVCFMEEFDM